MGFLLPVQLAPVEPRGRPGQQRRRQPLLHEPLARPLDRAHAHPHRRRDRRVDPPRAAVRLVGLEQDARVGQLARVGLAARDHALELAPLPRRERDPVPLRHRFAPPLLHPSGTAAGTARQTKADGALAEEARPVLVLPGPPFPPSSAGPRGVRLDDGHALSAERAGQDGEDGRKPTPTPAVVTVAGRRLPYSALSRRVVDQGNMPLWFGYPSPHRPRAPGCSPARRELRPALTWINDAAVRPWYP